MFYSSIQQIRLRRFQSADRFLAGHDAVAPDLSICSGHRDLIPTSAIAESDALKVDFCRAFGDSHFPSAAASQAFVP
jgi:hypothetical protein